MKNNIYTIVSIIITTFGTYITAQQLYGMSVCGILLLVIGKYVDVKTESNEAVKIAVITIGLVFILLSKEAPILIMSSLPILMPYFLHFWFLFWLIFLIVKWIESRKLA